MFAWLSNIFDSSKKSQKSPNPPSPPKCVTIFNTVSYLSLDGENSSPINLETAQKTRNRYPKYWDKTRRGNNQKLIVQAAIREHNDVKSTLGLYPQKLLTQIVSTKHESKPTGTKSILKRRR